MRRYKRIPKKSARKKLIDDCLNLIRLQMKNEYGNFCQLCGKPQKDLSMPLSLFHILPRSLHPKLILCKENLLLACWIKEKYYYMKAPTCHNIWEHQKFFKNGALNPKWVAVENKIKELRGKDYKEKLLIQEKIMPKITMFYLSCFYEGLKRVWRN